MLRPRNMQRILALSVILLAQLQPLLAAELCITCDNPAATYRCALDQMPQVKAYGFEPAAQAHICETVLAKKEHHASCHVVPNAQTCDGKSRTVTLTDYQRATAGEIKPAVPPRIQMIPQTMR